MSIPFDRYIAITSGVAAGAAANRRDLIGRLFTTSQEIPAAGIVEFTSLDDVLSRFGSTSEEYKRAAFYFGFISKNIKRPKKISFARWVDTDIGAYILGGKTTTTLAQFQAVTTGALTLTLGATGPIVVSGIDLSGALSLTDVASILQIAIRAADVDASFASCLVVWDSVNGRFTFTSGETGAETIVLSSTTGLDTSLAWTAATGAIISNGAATQTITSLLADSASENNNFGSFAFLYSCNLSLSEIIEAATWNDTNNVVFQYYPTVSAADASTLMASIGTLAGNGVTLRDSAVADEYPEMLPMVILAATDYTSRAAVQNFMFYQASLTPTVTTNADADTYDALRINYYGQTQQAGQKLSFYQRGVLTGQGTDPLDMNVYANEQWLKDAIGTELMNLLLALSRLSANAEGVSKITGIVQPIIDLAKLNGTISVGKELTPIQEVFIKEQTGDENAHHQVRTAGFWFSASVNATNSTASYVLIYSKDDVIRKVEGANALI